MSRARLTIDLGAIVENWRRLDMLAGPAETAAVVKADAYGLGAAQVAPALLTGGARIFFAALFEEAAALRDVLGAGPEIWWFNGPACAEQCADARARDLRPLLNSPHQIALARSEAQRADAAFSCGLQLDSGMNRLGLEPHELDAALADAEGLAGLAVSLVLSHLACADDPADPANGAQRAAFDAMTAAPALAAARRSLSATGGTLLGAEWRYDLVRPGIGLYGGAPFREAAPVARLDAPVIQIRDVAPGEAVGYGAAWRAERPTRVATVALGYADGLIRASGGRGRAFHRETPLPFLGRVSMDLLTLDAGAAPDLAPGDAVELLGPAQGVDALAAAAGTIGYEILTSLGARFERRWIGGAAQEVGER